MYLLSSVKLGRIQLPFESASIRMLVCLGGVGLPDAVLGFPSGAMPPLHGGSDGDGSTLCIKADTSYFYLILACTVPLIYHSR